MLPIASDIRETVDGFEILHQVVTIRSPHDLNISWPWNTVNNGIRNGILPIYPNLSKSTGGFPNPPPVSPPFPMAFPGAAWAHGEVMPCIAAEWGGGRTARRGRPWSSAARRGEEFRGPGTRDTLLHLGYTLFLNHLVIFRRLRTWTWRIYSWCADFKAGDCP